jgi:hypothetical protein
MFAKRICSFNVEELYAPTHLSNTHYEGKRFASVITAIKHFSVLKLAHIICLYEYQTYPEMRLNKELLCITVAKS